MIRSGRKIEVVVIVLLSVVVGVLIVGYVREMRSPIKRLSSDAIHIWSGADSGLLITNKLNMSIMRDLLTGVDKRSLLVPLTRRSSAWIFDVDELLKISTWQSDSYPFLVNPRLLDAVAKLRLIDDALDGNSPDFKAAELIASEGYIYLGWVARDIDEVRALQTYLATTRSEASNALASVQFEGRTLSRLRLEFESTELNLDRDKIPLLIERYDLKRQFPCDDVYVVFLDGHLESIRMESKFPATRSFYELFAE